MTAELSSGSVRASEHRYSLDLLRFFMAVGIAIYHFNGAFPFQVPALNTLIYSGGTLLADLFFFLSGCVMALREERTAESSFPRFFLSRARRVFPVYWVVLSVHAVICALGGEPIGLARFVSNMLLLPYILEDKRGIIDPPMWFLVVLLLCWWLFWLILFFTRRRGKNPVPVYFLLLVAGLTARLQIEPFSVISEPMTRGIVGFFGGCLLAHLDGVFHGKKAAVTGLAVLVFVGIIALLFPVTADSGYMICILLLFPGLLLFLLNGSFPENLLRNRFVRFLGGTAYAIFVLNAPVLSYEHGIIDDALSSGNGSVWTMLLIDLAILVLLAALVHRFLERPLTVFFTKAVQKLAAAGRAEGVRHDS